MHFIVDIFEEKYSGMLKNLSCLSSLALINLLANSFIYEINSKNEISNKKIVLYNIDDEELK